MLKKLFSVLSLLLLTGAFALAQHKVSGKVTDAKGEGMVGVSVLVKGTSTGTVTGNDGDYSLTAVKDNATLIFSSIGYVNQEVPVEGRAIVNVILEEDRLYLDETVVVGYATMKKRDLIGAVDAVGSQAIGNRAAANLTRALQGEIAGLNITFNDSKPFANSLSCSLCCSG